MLSLLHIEGSWWAVSTLPDPESPSIPRRPRGHIDAFQTGRVNPACGVGPKIRPYNPHSRSNFGRNSHISRLLRNGSLLLA
jgi:hypothetical protein